MWAVFGACGTTTTRNVLYAINTTKYALPIMILGITEVLILLTILVTFIINFAVPIWIPEFLGN